MQEYIVCNNLKPFIPSRFDTPGNFGPIAVLNKFTTSLLIFANSVSSSASYYWFWFLTPLKPPKISANGVEDIDFMLASISYYPDKFRSPRCLRDNLLPLFANLKGI